MDQENLANFGAVVTSITNAFHLNFKSFSDTIRDSYVARQRNRDLQWPPCFAEKLVRLELHQEVYNVYYNKQQRGGHNHFSISNREQLEYDDIFKKKPGGTIVRRVLVEGDAGIGKTTLCTSISIDWAEYKRLKQFDLVLLLPLRETAVTSVSSVAELLQLFHPNEVVCKGVADTFLQGELGKHVLIIADGWDELEPFQQKPESFIYQLLFNDAIHSATIMITSRPSASVALHKNPYIDRFIEIAGFDIRGIVQYINSEFARECEKASRDGLLQQLKENVLLRSICHVPINCAIVCHMWRSDESLPVDMTMTDIYTKIILHFMLRAFQKSFPEKGFESLNSFDAIPEDMQDCMSRLCKFAYDALVNDTYVFTYDSLKDVFPEAVAAKDQQGGQTFFTFGLMQSAQTFIKVGRGASFHFLHRTFQEYMSAFHVVRQSAENQTKLMKPYAYTSRMAISMRFVIGLGTSGYHISSRIRPLTSNTVCEVYEINNRVRVACVGWTNGLVVHGIHEAKEGAVKNYLLKLLYGDYFTFAFPRSAHDCATVVKAVEQFPKAMKISYRDEAKVSFKFEHCSLDEELLTNFAVALFNTEGKLHIKTLLIQDNKLSDGSICMLMNLAAPAFQSLKQLSLAANSLGGESITAISDYLMKNSIELLTLSYNPLGAEGALALQNAITEGTFSKLTNLQLKNCSLNNSEACTSLFQVLPDHCADLKQLDLSENVFDNPILIGESLAKLILMHKTLSELYLNEMRLGDEGATALANFLNSVNNQARIDTLSLKENGIHSEGISLLVQCINSSHLIIHDCLYMDGNSIGLSGCVSIASIINTKCISVCNCQLTVCAEDLKQKLKDELSKSPEIKMRQELILDNNCFTGVDIHILIQLVRMCPELKNLSCAGCHIDFKDLEKLLRNKNFSSSLAELETWSLQNNKLDNPGCSLLVTFVRSHLPKVTGIFIHGNNIQSKSVFELLEQEVAKHRPKGDIVERVLTALAPGVPYDKLRVIVEKHNAFEYLTDEEQDPVLLWDEYCRRGEEQRQQAEKIMGWTMSFQEGKLSEELIANAQKAFSTKSQELGADFMSALGNRQYSKSEDHEDSDIEHIMEAERENEASMPDIVPQQEPPAIELAGKVIPSSVVSSLATQFLVEQCENENETVAERYGQKGTSNLSPEIITSISQLAQTPFGQSMVGQVLQAHGFADIDYDAIDSSTILGPDNLRDVLHEVSTLKSSYFSFGVALGIPVSELEALKIQYSLNVEQALTDVLILWLRKNYPTSSTTPPTWRSLVKAVASSSGGNHYGLAVDIASCHPCSQPMDTSVP